MEYEKEIILKYMHKKIINDIREHRDRMCDTLRSMITSFDNLEEKINEQLKELVRFVEEEIEE